MSRGGVAPLRPERAFRHEAFFYATRDEFLAWAIPFVREGITAGEPTMVVLDADKLELLRCEFGDADGVWFSDMAEVGHNPARLIPIWHDFVDEHLGRGVGIRGMGEPIRPHLAEPVLVECQQHEALINLAFPEFLDLWLVCPYDTTVLAADVLDEAHRTHPLVRERGVRIRNSDYRDVAAVRSPPGEPLPEPPSSTMEVTFDASCLGTVRALVAGRAREVGLDVDREADLVLSVNEIAANSIQYAGGSGTLLIWLEPDALVCEVRDPGTITEPLVGRLAPGTSPESSRGLWVVNQLCDLVQVRSSATGTQVRMRMSLGGHRSPR